MGGANLEWLDQIWSSVNFRQNVFSGDSVSTTIHLPSREVLEPITGSFIPSAQHRDGSLFLDLALQIRKIKVLFNAHAYATE